MNKETTKYDEAVRERTLADTWTAEDEAKWQAEGGCPKCDAIGSHLEGCPLEAGAR